MFALAGWVALGWFEAALSVLLALSPNAPGLAGLSRAIGWPETAQVVPLTLFSSASLFVSAELSHALDWFEAALALLALCPSCGRSSLWRPPR